MPRIKHDAVLRAALVSAFIMLSLGLLQGGGSSGPRIGKPDLTIYSSDVDPLNIGFGVMNYPDYYDPVEYRDQVTTMDFSEDVPNEGDLVLINLTVFNIGIEEGSAEVEFYDGPREGGVFIGSDNVTVQALDYDKAIAVWDTLGVEGEEHEIFAYIIPEDPTNETDEGNNAGSEQILVNFFPHPEISGFTGPDPFGEILEGDIVSFDGSGTSDTKRDMDAGLIMRWEFNDANSNMTDPGAIEGEDLFNSTHVFTDEGEYLVNLTVIDQHGASAVDSVIVNVDSRAPKPAITVPDGPIMEDEAVTFRSDSTDDSPHDLPLMEYRWDLGDGTFVDWTNGTSVEHIYTGSGEYLITLTARDEEGLEGSISVMIMVENSPPIAVIESISVNGAALDPSRDRIVVMEDDRISLSGKGHDTPSDISSLRSSWYLDGALLGHDDTVELTFPKQGEHLLALDVVDDEGNSSSAILTIEVDNQVPVADAGPDLVLSTNVAVLDASASSDTPSDMEGLEYLWDVGRGSVLKGRVVEHTFEGKGDFDVRLTVRDDDGAASSDRLRVTIENMAPLVSIDGPQEVQEDEVFILDGSGSVDVDGSISRRHWTVDGVDAGSEAKLRHVFHRSGNHTVLLRLTDDRGATSVLDHHIRVENLAPLAEAGGDNESIVGTEMVFDGRLTKDTPSDLLNLTFIWKVDGNATYEGVIASHRFDAPGDHIVELRVIDDDGAFSLDSFVAWVRDLTLRSISISLSLDPSRCGPGTDLRAFGRVDYDVVENAIMLDLSFAPVRVTLGNHTVLARPNRDGSFSVELEAPLQNGEYRVTARIDRFGLTGEAVSILTVREEEALIVAVVTSPVFIGVGASLVLTAVGAGAVMSTDIGRWKFFLLLVPLFSRLSRDRVLENFVRGRIYQYILMNPGENFSRIREMLDINLGTLTYHLTVLEREEYIRSVTEGRYKRFYPFGMRVEPGPHQDIQELILMHLSNNPGMSQKEIAESIGIHVSTVNYHINMMVGAGILNPVKKGQVQRYEVKYIAREVPID